MSRRSDPVNALLFLSLPSPSAGVKCLHDGWSPILSLVLQDMSETSSPSSSPRALKIALITTVRGGKDAPHQTYDYNQLQADIAGVYQSLCLVSIQEDITLQGPNGVDVQVVVLSSIHEEVIEDQGPLISLFSLAQSHQNWTKVYAPNDTGHWIIELFEDWNAAGSDQEAPWQVQQVPVHSPIPRHKTPTRMDDAPKGRQHAVVAVGGTFDHLHIGHKLLLTMTASLLENSDSDTNEPWRRLIVGITGDELLTQKKYAEYLESWMDRQYKVFQFLQSIIDFRPSTHGSTLQPQNESGPDGKAVHYVVGKHTRIECVEIKDPFGPTISDPSISALALSGETRDGGTAINDKRREKGWPELEVFEVDVLDAELPVDGGNKDHVQQSFEGKISSTELRRQESMLAAASR
jgi:phosphopantetheine adenylyltransferase